jgi:hypothetical protein
MQPPALDACGSIDSLSMMLFNVECSPYTGGGGCYGMYVHIPDRVISMDGDGIGPCTQVHAVGCSPDSVCLYRRRVMN